MITPTFKRYYIAYVTESGDWDIVDEFEAENDAEANIYAEDVEGEWYVLDEQKRNINAERPGGRHEQENDDATQGMHARSLPLLRPVRRSR